jgi:hypothetical protein
MEYTMNPELAPATVDQVVGRYVAVWNEPDPRLRRGAIAALWAEDGVELVESAQFRGHEELEARVAEAHEEFVVNRKFAVTSANDATGHHGAITVTIQLVGGGDVAWAARVFLILDENDLIRYDYQFTVKPLAS